MWIMVTKHIPTEVSPPKYGIFWAVPWIDDKYTKEYRKFVAENYCKKRGVSINKQRNKSAIDYVWKLIRRELEEGTLTLKELEDFPGSVNSFWGLDPTHVKAVKIIYKGTAIKLWDHEYSIISDEHLREYIQESHELQLDNTPEAEVMDVDLEIDPSKKILVDAALLEGASEAEAKAMALGLYSPDDDYIIAPVGWYKIKPEYENALP